MINVLVLGANGQLGSDMCKSLRAHREIHVILHTRDDFDLVSGENLPDYLSQYSLNFLINCTGLTNTGLAEENQDLANSLNSKVPKTLAQYCSSRDIILFHFSTDYVFDGEQRRPYTEDDLPMPLNHYGISKLNGEKYVLENCVKSFVIRISSLYGTSGASGKKLNFIDYIIEQGALQKPVKMVTDQFMVPTHTMDVVALIIYIIEYKIKKYGLYHGVPSGSCSWFEFATKTYEFLGIKNKLIPLSLNDFPSKFKRPVYSVLCNNKVQGILGFPHWEESLKMYLIKKGLLK